MKAKLLAATAFAAVVTAMSCKWFTQKNDEYKSGFLAGRYELTGITDSSSAQKLKPGDTLKWFFNSPLNDSSQRYLNFSNDSLMIYEAATRVDSMTYYSDTANKVVYLKNGGVYQRLNIIQLSDSTINLVAVNDSVCIALKKL